MKPRSLLTVLCLTGLLLAPAYASDQSQFGRPESSGRKIAVAITHSTRPSQKTVKPADADFNQDGAFGVLTRCASAVPPQLRGWLDTSLVVGGRIAGLAAARFTEVASWIAPLFNQLNQPPMMTPRVAPPAPVTAGHALYMTSAGRLRTVVNR